VEAVLRRCLEKAPHRRYPTAQALAEDLGRCLRGEPVRARRRPLRAVALVLVALLAGALVGATARPDREQEQPDAPITLIGASGPPARGRWIVGEKEATVAPAVPGGPFTAQTDELCLLELPPSPWPHFRLEAQVRHEASKEGQVGLFVAYARYPTARGDVHSFWKAGFAEQGRHAGNAELAVWRYQEPGNWLTGHAVRGPHPFRPGGRPGAQGPWRALAVEITGQGLRAFLGEDCIGEASIGQAQKLAALLHFDIPGARARFAPGVPLGIYLHKGRASFREVVVKRVP
jgi:hypothetical protein